MKKFLVALAAALISLPVLADVTGIVSPPGGSGSSLPSQTGNSGKYLTTDGTSPSWASPTASASSITPGTTTVVGSTAPCLIDNSATTVMGCLAETGTGSAVLATSPTLVTPNLGTPSAINLTNASALPCSATPALTGDVTTTAGSCGTTVSKVNGASLPASAGLLGTNSSSQIIAAPASGVTAGSYTSADITVNAQGQVTSASNGTASASSITPGTTTVSGATAPCLIDNSTGTTMGCAGIGQGLALSSGTIDTSAPTRTVTASPTVASTDMGGAIFMNVSGGGTLTIPAIGSGVFGNGQTLVVTNYSASTATVTTTPTVNSGGGCVSGTGIPSGDSWQLVSNGTSLDCIQTTPTSSGGGSSAWSALTNPAANLSLSMAGYTTTFDQTSGVNWSWNDTTAATSSTVGDSPIINLGGTYWNGTASASDTWSIQNILGTGTNGTSTLTFSHSGTSGADAVSVPDQLSVTNAGNVGFIQESGTNLYVQPPSGGVLRLSNGSSSAITILNNGGGSEGTELDQPISYQVTQTTVTGTSAGSAVWSYPVQKGAIADTVIYLNGYENTTGTAQTIPLPQPYATVAYVTTDGGTCTGITITTGASSTVTLPANMSATQTGLCEIKGY